MARPVKETPVLKGQNAREFEKNIKEREKQKVSESEYQRAQATYETIKLVG